MNQTAKIISIYAADTSGFCSALYEYGGMTVIHDASGCNSTYTTHDEPRWYDKDSMMYISGFTERDAIMGNDDKFIHDLVLAANELKPEFVAICASPLPAMTGVDLDAIAYEVENETGIPAFQVRTNGMQSYITGVQQAFLELAKKFCPAPDEKPDRTASKTKSELSVNVLGITPLDFPISFPADNDSREKGSSYYIRKWLEDAGCKVNSMISVDTSLDEIKRLGEADVSLVVSSGGRLIAEYLYETYGIPFVVGTPYGKKYSEKIIEAFKTAIDIEGNVNAAGSNRVLGDKVAVIGESVLSSSLAAAISLEYGLGVRILESVGDGDMTQLILRPSDDWSGDVSCDDEDILEKEIRKSEIIIADPLFEPICKGKKFIRLPHDAFSGRCFHKEAVNLINAELDEVLHLI